MRKLRTHVGIKLLVVVCSGLALWFALVPRGTFAAPSDGTISGLVTDAAGKPVKGAPVTATVGNIKSIARFTNASGKYEISGLEPGTYTIVVTAWGYGTKSVTKQVSSGTTDVTFSLKESWNPRIISSAEFISAYPGDKGMRALQSGCDTCHNFAWINRRRGMTEEEWSDFIPNMGNKFIHPHPNPAQLKEWSSALGRIFGPDSPMPEKDKVQHSIISDEALDATWHFYTPPTPNFAIAPHIGASGTVWFTEFDNTSNKIVSFDPATEKFNELPIPSPEAGPHNPWVAKNGTVWITENGPIGGKKIAMLDPETNKITELTPPDPNCNCTHTIKEDSQGNMWMSTNITKLDAKTLKFTIYHTPSTYDLGLDSHDNAWGFTGSSNGGFGGLFRVDGKTGEIKKWPMAEMQTTYSGTTSRGMDVDAQDNVWFGDVLNHRVGRFNQKTEQFTYFKSPTANMSPYGVTVSKRTGDVWVADFDDSSIIRITPSTGKVVYYPFPTRLIMTRFVVEDRNGMIWFSDFENGRVGYLDPGRPKTTAQR